MAHNSISNTSPTFFQVGEGEYVIADTWNFQEDEEDEQEKLPEGWQALAPINTDLWAYSLMDYQEYLKQGGSPVSENDHGKKGCPHAPGRVQWYSLPLLARVEGGVPGPPGGWPGNLRNFEPSEGLTHG